jgi:class 3 adenylate cyclase
MAMSRPRRALISWLQHEANRCPDPGVLLVGLCQRLVEAELPLRAAALSIATLHPLVAGSTFTWRRDRTDTLEMPRFHGMPGFIAAVADHDDGPRLDLSLRFSEGGCHSLALTSDRPDGFDRGERARLRRTAALLASPLEIVVTRQTAAILLATYLGARSGARVLAGAIQRGDGETIHAVLWYSDLRGFTVLSDTLPRDRLIALLNAHFERLAAPIKAFGGEVLKLMGDGLLAIFPTEPDGAARACDRALRAARGARAGMAVLNDERMAAGESPLVFGLALHLGDVMYGNIGAPDRLDFTVIGPAVNFVSRLEALCKKLDRPVLISAAFARACSESLAPLGSYALPGITPPAEVFTLAELHDDRRAG